VKTPWSDRVRQLDTRWRRTGLNFYRKEIVKALRKLNPRTILDVGCGSGILYSYLPFYLRKRYTGVDFTEEFITLNRQKYPDAAWIVADALHLPFNDGTFELVTTTTVLQHIENWKEALAEIFRVSSRYALLTERIHEAPTTIVSNQPVLRRRFSWRELFDELSTYGTPTYRTVFDRSGQSLGMYVVRK